MRTINQKLNTVEKQILRKNEINANHWCAYVMLIAAGCNLLGWLLAYMVHENVDNNYAIAYFINIMACLLCGLFVVANEGKSKADKYFICFTLGVCCFTLITLAFFGYDLMLLSPIVISIVYCDYFFTALVGMSSIFLYLCSVAASSILALEFGIVDANGLKIEVTSQFYIHYNFSGNAAVNRQNILSLINARGTDIAYMLLGLAVSLVVCCLLSNRGLKMLKDTADVYREQQKAEKEANDVKTKIMISQLQPHFLYNSLSAIMAIDNNPPETVQALAEFSRYLRGNLNSLTVDDLIPFTLELEHIKHYAALEKLRFGEKLNIIYNIETEKFLLPPLTVQMAVENAIKHGISKQENGGTVSVSTKTVMGGVQITVTDDGNGFDVSTYIDKDIPGHVGLKSAKQRITDLTGGVYKIESTIDVGTVVTIFIPDKQEVTDK